MRSLWHRVSTAGLLTLTLASPLYGQLAQPPLQSVPPSALGAQEEEFCCDEKHLGNTLIGMSFVVAIPWFFNRYVADDSTAVINPSTWADNIKEGFEWDHDNFKTNMFAHPYHGSLYFNAGRSNGYDFWGSAAWAWGGSFIWEMFGENNNGAINDWIATAVGGIAIGEMLHRTSLTIWDNQATGTERTLREIGGFLVNPEGGASRLFRGEMRKTGRNPEGRFPSSISSNLNFGVRHVGEGGRAGSSTGATAQYALRYGDPFEEHEKPFDWFQFNVTLNGRNEESSLNLAQIRAGLWSTDLHQSSTVQHKFLIEQQFNYINNRSIESGGSSVTATFLSRWALEDDWDLVTRVAPGALLIWGVDSEYATSRSATTTSAAASPSWAARRSSRLGTHG